MSTLLTLIGSFCLSAIAYDAAQPREAPVQHYELEEDIINPGVQYYSFGELVAIAQADEADDGDGANIDMMNAHWCDIHPDKCNIKDDDEEQGGDDEEGC